MKKVLMGIGLALWLAGNGWALDANLVEVEELAKASSSWNGKALPDYAKGQPEITILRIKVPPGVQLPMHKHTVINAGVMLNGELTVITQNGETLHLKAGDSIVEVVDTWHYGRNDGKDAAEIVVFYAGISGSPLTVKKEASHNKASPGTQDSHP